jgi:hypothetical protein
MGQKAERQQHLHDQTLVANAKWWKLAFDFLIVSWLLCWQGHFILWIRICSV